jgi:hypothetical protein
MVLKATATSTERASPAARRAGRSDELASKHLHSANLLRWSAVRRSSRPRWKPAAPEIEQPACTSATQGRNLFAHRNYRTTGDTLTAESFSSTIVSRVSPFAAPMKLERMLVRSRRDRDLKSVVSTGRELVLLSERQEPRSVRLSTVQWLRQLGCNVLPHGFSTHLAQSASERPRPG